MEIYEIRSFSILADQLHFGRAAKILNVTQPALTKQIRNLEDDLGGTLFDRGSYGTSLTALGQFWLPKARELLERFDQLVNDGQRGASGQIGRLRIGFGFHSLEVVPPIIVSLREQSPELEILLRDMSTREQEIALNEGQLDIGFLRMPTTLGSDYEKLPILRDRMVLVGSADGNEKKKLTLADCRERPFVMITPRRSPGFFSHAVRLCATCGFYPRVVQEVTEFTTAIALVRAGMGVTLIPESIWKNKFTEARCHKIPGNDSYWAVSAVWRKRDSNPVLNAFIEQLKRKAS